MGTRQHRADVLDQLAEMIITIDRRHPVRVGIDGFSAAGKSTLADEIHRAIEHRGVTAVRVELDDFKRPRTDRAPGPAGFYRTAWDLDAIRDHVLSPLGPGGNRTIRTRYFDQQRQAAFPVETRLVPSTAIVVVVGGYLLRPELRADWDFTIFTEIGFDLVLSRGAERDAAWMESPEAAAEHYRSFYIPAEQLYEREAAPQAHADVVVDNTDFAHPVLHPGGRRR